MLRLSRGLVLSVVPGPIAWGSPGPLQASLGGCPWRVTVASMLLCRTRRVQAEPVLRRLLGRYPDAASLCRAEDLEALVRPCGLHRNRARQLGRFSCAWLGDGWSTMQELPGVGLYVADAVGLFCFGCTELESSDEVLREHARSVGVQPRCGICGLDPHDPDHGCGNGVVPKYNCPNLIAASRRSC